MTYLKFQTLPKSVTTEEDMGTGQVALRHLAPTLFLELQQVKLHKHTGSDSRTLAAESTPEMVRSYTPGEREEHGVAPWSGGASTSGSVVLTFATPFLIAPNVYITVQSGNANIIVGTDTPTTTGVTIYWQDAISATHTSLNLAWLAKGR